jgi:hypothetical protein
MHCKSNNTLYLVAKAVLGLKVLDALIDFRWSVCRTFISISYRRAEALLDGVSASRNTRDLEPGV